MEEIPGDHPYVSIGRAAVKAAWLIEKEKERKATPEEVIERMQEWATTGNLAFGIYEAVEHGVKWKTKRNRINKTYVIGSCVKTLERWHESRHRADSGAQ